MKGQYFYVHDVPFENYWAACEYGKSVNGWIEAKVDPWHLEQWADVDPQQVKSKPIWYWIDKQIHNIFSQYSKPRLHWSGGTDSHTVLVKTHDLGYRWHAVYTYWMSVFGEPEGADTEVKQPVKWFTPRWQQYTDHWEHWKPWSISNPLWYYTSEWQPGLYKIASRKHLGFASHNRQQHVRYFDNCNGPADINITGHAKPMLFKLDDQWYWIQTHGFNDGTASIPKHIDFFMDGATAKLSVATVYAMRNWYNQHYPEKQGWFTYGSLDMENKFKLLPELGRVNLFSKKIGAGLLGKGVHSLNQKHVHAMQELIDKGYTDIVQQWKDRVQEVVDAFEGDHRWVKVFEVDDPLNPGHTMKFPYMQDHIQWCMKITDKGLEQVDHVPIIDEYNSKM